MARRRTASINAAELTSKIFLKEFSMQILNELLDSLIVGAPQVFEEVQVIPLFSNQHEAAATFLQLDEALKQGLAEITEVSDAGSVPPLSIINKSPQDLIIYDGQELIGAKQNRIVHI